MATAQMTLTHRSLSDRLHGFFAAIGRAFVISMENSSRLSEVEKYNAMSDEQLARIGLKRDEIVHHVYADLFYC